jgi:hypothetical protein
LSHNNRNVASGLLHEGVVGRREFAFIEAATLLAPSHSRIAPCAWNECARTKVSIDTKVLVEKNHRSYQVDERLARCGDEWRRVIALLARTRLPQRRSTVVNSGAQSIRQLQMEGLMQTFLVNSSEKVDGERTTLTLKNGPRKSGPPIAASATVKAKKAPNPEARWTEGERRRVQAFITR